MRFLRAGRSAVLVEVDDLETVIALSASLRRDPPAGVTDMVPAARTLLLVHDDSTSLSRLAERVRTQASEHRAKRGAERDDSQPLAPGGEWVGAPVEIRVTYDGADLADVARRTGLAETEVVRRHAGCDYVVAFIGFAPGFAYLVGGDPALRVARRDSPRTKVPAGSVALAGEFTGVYPRGGPGGWQLIGSTHATLWDLDRDPPALLPPGTPVRFVAGDQ